MQTDRYEDMDKAALHNALLALKQCPLCRNDLQPVALCADVWGCEGKAYPTHCFETWFVPQETSDDDRT